MKNSLERLGSTPATDQYGKIHTVDVFRTMVTVSMDGNREQTLPGNLLLQMNGEVVTVIDRTHVEVPQLRLLLTLAMALPEDAQA